MDESWKMRMGLNLPRRRSTEEISLSSTKRNISGRSSLESDALDATDFSDVFGGPPRSALSRQLSGDFMEANRSSSSSFFEDIFRSPDPVARTLNSKTLPIFRIPATECGGRSRVFRRSDGFYDDIFGSEDDRRSRSRSLSKPNSKSKSKSRSNSSSVLSSEDMSPRRCSVADDVAFSSFASKLRPINIPCRWSSSSRMPEEHHGRQGISAVPGTHPSYMEYKFTESALSENFRTPNHGFSQQIPSPEAIFQGPSSHRSIKISVNNREADSPSSVVSSICQDTETKTRITKNNLQEREEEEEVSSSYVIEITSKQRDGLEKAVDIDEAIAWAKEKFQTQSTESLNKTRSQQQKARQYEREPLAQKEV